MKKLLFLFIVFLLFYVQSICAQDYKTTFSVEENGNYSILFELKNWNIKHVNYNDIDYQKIVFSTSTKTNKKGWAELPTVSTSFQLPNDKNFELINIQPIYEEIILDYPLLPSRGTIYRNQNPNEIPYEINPESIIDEFYPKSIYELTSPFIIRNVRGTTVTITPFQYNPVTKILRICTKIILIGECNNKTEIINPLLNVNNNLTKDEIGMYKSIFVNYTTPKQALATGQYGDILVITTPRDSATINPYIKWKLEKGYKVTKEVVATNTNVKNLIQQKYNSNPNIFYVQLVGDWADIKSDLGGGANAPTDPIMGCVNGTDNFPDIAIGRFSCSNSTELQTQINKTINYEKNPNMEANWRETFIGIASDEGNGFGDDGEIDYDHIKKIYNLRIEPFTYNQHLQNYDPNANKTTLAGHINSGASTIAYCGHGAETSFVTTKFNNSDINNLNNGDKLPFIMSVACVNGKFHQNDDCFAEAWLKKQNGGAVVTVMSTINQPWTPPQRIQDYFYDILVGGFDYSLPNHGNGLNNNEQRTFWGAIMVNASNLGLSESSSSEDIETVQTWTTFGDASLQLRTKQPIQITNETNIIFTNIPYETTIKANGLPIANAMVCISQNGVYYSSLTNNLGEVSIENNFTAGEVLLVVTAFNTTTIYEIINCIVPQKPYIVKNDYSLANDGILTYGETTDLTLSLKNIGLENLDGNSTVTISCSDPLLTINTGTAVYPPIAIQDIVSVSNAFNITCSPEITNGYNFTIHYTIINGINIWEGNIQVPAYKPELQFGQIMWLGSFQAGTTIPIAISYKNIGGYTAFNANGTLECNNPNITILNPTFNYGTIQTGGETFGNYLIEISPNATENDIFNFNSNIIADNNITANGTFNLANTFACTVVVDMQDSYGDGWNDAKLTFVFSDGTPNKVCQLLKNTPNAAAGSDSFTVNKNTYVEIKWTKGTISWGQCWDSECSFQIHYDNGTTIYNSNGTPQQGILTSFTSNCSHEVTECAEILDIQFEYIIDTSVVLNWQINGEINSFTIVKNGLVIATTTENTYTDTEITNGETIIYSIIANNNNNENCMIFPLTATYTVPIICNIPLILTGYLSSNNVNLSWNFVECAESYSIYCNNNLLISGLTTTNYTHENINYGNLCYYVKTVNFIGESDPSNEVCINYSHTIINDNQNNYFSIYPNPTTSNLTVICENMQQIDIYSIENKLIKSYYINSDKFDFNINELAKGFYFIIIKNNTGIITSKIVKE